MGRKIFISYKFADSNVQRLPNKAWYESTTVRDYVDKLETYFDSTNDIFKAESNNEDLSYLSDDAIWEKLKSRIYDSSTTIIMISPGMKEPNRSERSQWIPWEVSFSLKETTRSDRTSHSNALLAVVLPDQFGSYDYYISGQPCGVVLHKTETLFPIIANNKFNLKNPKKFYCGKCGSYHYQGCVSYIDAVKWEDFILAPNFYIENAHDRRDNIDDYEIHKNL